MQRRDIFSLASLLQLPPSIALADVGLAERRAIASYRQDKWPPIEQAIRKAAGFDVPIDVEWDQLTVSGDAKYYGDGGYFGKTIFEPLTAALASITADQMGRDALKAKLQRIHVRFDEMTAVASNYLTGLIFQNGTLDINWRPFANVDAVADRTKALTQIMEKNL